MSESAADRKKRLRAMREEAEAEEGPQLKFRNYTPQSEGIEHEKIAAAKAPEIAEPEEEEPEEEEDVEDVLVNVAPKKANWDLRRDVAKKLEKLERRTQKAMIELMQEEEDRRATGEEEE